MTNAKNFIDTFAGIPVANLDIIEVSRARSTGLISKKLEEQMEKYWREEENNVGVKTKYDSPMDRQEGGDHYKKYPIQPIQYALENKLNFGQANAIKYITRYRDKGGKQDLLKAIHNIELLIEFEYPENIAEAK